MSSDQLHESVHMNSCLTVNNLATKRQFWVVLKIIAAASCMVYSVTAHGQMCSLQSSLQQSSTTEHEKNMILQYIRHISDTAETDGKQWVC